MALDQKTSEVLANNPRPIGKGAWLDWPKAQVQSKPLPSWVRCCVCGMPPVGADWLKPVNPDPSCRRFIHLSHIENGPGVGKEAGFILRNA